MKKSDFLFVVGIAGSCVFSAVAENGPPVTRRGSPVLHYMTRNDLVATDAGSNTVGSLRLQYNEQGHSLKQSFRLVISGLETNSPVGLTAIVGDDTNTVLVSTLNTDGKGRARVSYLSRGQGGGGRNPLPDALSPLTSVRSIGVENSSNQTVAYAVITDASQFHYLVKRNLTPEDTNGTAAGSISLTANQRHVNFRLIAGGVNATNDYHLALNSNVVSTVTSDEDGRLRITSWPSNAPAILDLRSLSLLDSGSNTVLSTTLPR
jgi:hypothetical protein